MHEHNLNSIGGLQGRGISLRANAPVDERLWTGQPPHFARDEQVASV